LVNCPNHDGRETKGLQNNYNHSRQGCCRESPLR
jgi:hypothetical protein